jgi:hypothetical protein
MTSVNFDSLLIKHGVSPIRVQEPEIEVVSLLRTGGAALFFVSCTRAIPPDGVVDGILVASDIEGQKVAGYVNFFPHKKRLPNAEMRVSVHEEYLVCLPDANFNLFYSGGDGRLLPLRPRSGDWGPDTPAHRVLITGAPKSGTTMMCNIINAFDDCRVFNEVGFTASLDYPDSVSNAFSGSIEPFGRGVVGQLFALTGFISQVGRRVESKVLGLKMPRLSAAHSSVWTSLDSQRNRVIVSLRDPLDVLVSLVHHHYHLYRHSFNVGEGSSIGWHLNSCFSSGLSPQETIAQLDEEFFSLFLLRWIEDSSHGISQNVIYVDFESFVENFEVAVRNLASIIAPGDQIAFDSVSVRYNVEPAVLRESEPDFYRDGGVAQYKNYISRGKIAAFRVIVRSCLGSLSSHPLFKRYC